MGDELLRPSPALRRSIFVGAATLVFLAFACERASAPPPHDDVDTMYEDLQKDRKRDARQDSIWRENWYERCRKDHPQRPDAHCTPGDMKGG